MADQARAASKKSSLTLEQLREGSVKTPRTKRTGPADLVVTSKKSVKRKELTPVQLKAAELWSRGWTVPQIAKRLAEVMHPDVAVRKRQLQVARATLRRWSVTQAFRDAVWNHTMIRADLASGPVVDGVISKARAGRVDAARLVLELNGRHSPFTEDKPASINIVFNGIPRPQSQEEYVEGEAEELEDDGS